MVNLREKRESKGLTQEALANKVHVTRQAIGNIENGSNKPSVEVAKLIAEELEFDWTEFFE